MRRYLRSILSVALAVALVCPNFSPVVAAEETEASKNILAESRAEDVETQEEDKNFLQKLTELISGQKPEAETETTSEKTTEKTTEKTSEEAKEKETEKTTEKATEHTTKKVSEKTAEKTTERVVEKAEEKTGKKAPEKMTEKTKESETDKAAEKNKEKTVEKAVPIRVGNVEIFLDQAVQTLTGADDSYLKGLTTQKLDFTVNNVTLMVEDGGIYGSKNNPILPEYTSNISMPKNSSVLNLLWNPQKEKEMEEYQFVNQIPDEIRIPSPVYFEGGESVLEAKEIRSRFRELNHGNRTVGSTVFYEHSWSESIMVRFHKGSIEGISNNEITWIVSTPMSVLYTVDIAPLNEGGEPVIGGLSGLGSKTTLAPRVQGVNSQYFRDGEVNSGVDGGETLLCGEKTAVLGSHTGTGMRGYGSYGAGYSWDFKPDEESGYSVDCVYVTVYDPMDTSKKLLDNKKFSASELSQIPSAIQGKTEIRVQYTKDPDITKTGSLPEEVKKGDEITYTLTVTNPGSAAREVKVKDFLQAQVEAVSYTIDGVKQPENWTGQKNVTIPPKTEETDGTVVIQIKAKVTEDYSGADRMDNVIQNKAFLEYQTEEGTKTRETEVVKHYLKPVISYTLEKKRVTEPEGGGFIAGEDQVIVYTATVENTGTLPLTLKISDQFAEPDSFLFVGDTAKEGITLKVGEKREVSFQAKVRKGTAPNLDGYLNTVTAEAEASYVDAKTGSTITVDKTTPGYEQIMELRDTAKTPVIATIWVANTTESDRGGTVEVSGFADTVNRISSDGADDNRKNRKPALEVKGTADEKWIVDTASITVGVRDLEAVTIQDTAVDGRFTVQDSQGNVITGTLLVSEDQRSVTVKTDSLDQDLDVGIAFIPTIQVANVKVTQDKTKGGTVEVTDFSEPTRDETDRYPSNVVFGIPEAGWQVAVDTITVNGVRVRGMAPGEDGTYTVTDQDQNQITVQIEETARGTAVRILGMQVPVDVEMEFEPTIFVKNPTDTQEVENGGSVWVENATQPDPEDSGDRCPSNVVLGRPMNDRWIVDTENIKVNGVAIHPNERGEFQITDSNGYVIKGNLQMPGKDAVVTILDMDTLVDVEIPFAPTIWVENSTKDEQNNFTNAGGTVNVQNYPKDPAGSGGNHDSETGRYPEQSVTGTPDPGWKVDRDAITVNGVPFLKEGVPNGDGTYTVTVESGYQITVDLKDGENGAVVVEVMNMDIPVDVSIPFVRMETVLKIHKVNVNGNPEDVFHFTVTLGSSQNPYTGSYTIHQETKQYTGPFTVSLKGGETVELKGIYALTEYQVAEEANDRYVSASINAEGVLEKENTDYTVEFTNTLREAGLNISKTVVGGNGEDYFAFQVTVDEKSFEGSYTVNGKEKQTTDGMITLKGGQTAVIQGLPAEVKYQVEEMQAGFYKLTDSSNTSGTLKAGEAVDVQFENTKKAPESVSVWVKAEKKYTNGTLSSGLFSFRLSGEGKTEKAVNDADGTISFPKLTYSKTGTYRYTLSEVKGSLSDVEYDTTAYEVTVKVTLDEKNNRLKAIATYTKNGQKASSPVFTNVKKAATPTSKASTPGKTTPGAKTADQTPVMGLTFLLLAAGAVLLLLTGRRKKA